jgi:hypothetical protein
MSIKKDEDDSDGAEVRVKVNLRSVDAMFAKILTEASSLKEYVKDRLDFQDRSLEDIKQQGSQVKKDMEKRVADLEHIRDTNAGKMKGFILAWGMVVGLLGFILEKLGEKLFGK